MMFAAALLAAALWTPHPSDGVEMHLTRDGAINRLDFDFHGHAGYAIARQKIDRELPPNYQLTFRIRGDAPPENLELKLLDATGDNVWWLNRRDFVFAKTWTTLKTKKRQISFAWGPRGGGELARVDSLELVVTAGSGGKGSVWFSDPDIEPLPPTPVEPVRFETSTIDFGTPRELGGLTIDWRGVPPKTFAVLVDGVATTHHSTKFIWLPDAEARTIQVTGAVDAITVQPPSWAPTENDFVKIVARAAPRGAYPRYFLGEQSYWTVIGAAGGAHKVLVGEDANVEPWKGGFSLEPVLVVGGKRLTWADVTATHSLAEAALPIPSVTWTRDRVTMRMTAAVSNSEMLQLRYVIDGDAELQIQARPYQVNPSTQWLNTTGGVSRIDETLFATIRTRTKPSRIDGHTFVYRNAREVELDVPLALRAKRESFARIEARWRDALHRVAIDIPSAPDIANTLRTSVAYMLIEKKGAALQPGARSYDRAWIRDGALMASLLLRLGHADVAKAFAEWFAKYQYEDGKVPCCVDHRGADPVPENDSHGELIFLIAEIHRYTHDDAFVRRLWPHVDAAARYIDTLRARNHGAFEGLVTESISHEGYSAKPMHSYWDDFFALRGLEDAAALARVIGNEARQRELVAHAADLRRDLAASIARSMSEHHIDYVPGSAELGDFDATSTAIGISPLGLTSVMPQAALRRTFARYLETLQKPREDYTPYEMRNIGALIRLGERDAAAQLVDRSLRDRRPAAWNEWAEVVRTDPRKAGFIGDMPHAWVASDYVRSILDAIAFDREDGALVIGAGVVRAWLARGPLHVGPLATYAGTIDVTMRASADAVTISLAGDATPRALIVRSPDPRPIEEALVDGVAVSHGEGEVTIARLPARVEFRYAPASP
jgi:hypothetical protein